jgi:hypothetical protein
MMSMHKLTAGDGHAYLTRQVAAGDGALQPGASLTAYYEQTGNPPGRSCGAGLAGLGVAPEQAAARHAVVGYDLTFTAPKSVSVLWALADDETRAAVYGARRAASAATLAFVEQTVVRTRVGQAGCRQVRTAGQIHCAEQDCA